MTLLGAEKLLALIEDTYGKDSARLVSIENGFRYAVLIKRGCWMCWNFDDWEAYRRVDKRKEAKKRCKAEM